MSSFWSQSTPRKQKLGQGRSIPPFHTTTRSLACPGGTPRWEGWGDHMTDLQAERHVQWAVPSDGRHQAPSAPSWHSQHLRPVPLPPQPIHHHSLWPVSAPFSQQVPASSPPPRQLPTPPPQRPPSELSRGSSCPEPRLLGNTAYLTRVATVTAPHAQSPGQRAAMVAPLRGAPGARRR